MYVRKREYHSGRKNSSRNEDAASSAPSAGGRESRTRTVTAARNDDATATTARAVAYSKAVRGLMQTDDEHKNVMVVEDDPDDQNSVVGVL